MTGFVDHSGFDLPEPNVDLTLVYPTFRGQSGRLRLADVPPVLVAECRADAFLLAGVPAPEPAVVR